MNFSYISVHTKKNIILLQLGKNIFIFSEKKKLDSQKYSTEDFLIIIDSQLILTK